jgi:hypothetical protein
MLAESVSKATINSMHIGSSHKSNFEFCGKVTCSSGRYLFFGKLR